MVEEIFAPRRKFLVALVEVSAVVAEGSWALGAVADGPDGCAPNPAVCAPPCLSFTIVVSLATF
jgi:hypothetical protein